MTCVSPTEQYQPSDSGKRTDIVWHGFGVDAYSISPAISSVKGAHRVTNNNWGTPPNAPASSTSTKRNAVIAAAILGIIALAAGITWAIASPGNSDTASNSATASFTPETTPETAVDQATESTTPTTKKNYTFVDDPEYTREQKCGEMADAFRDKIDNPMTVFCDDDWLLLAQENSSLYYLHSWAGNSWIPHEADGEFSDSHMDCYDRKELIEDGLPEQYVDDVPLCSSEELAAADQEKELKPGYLGDLCDGSYILIVDSVLVPYGELRTPYVDQALAQHPGAKSMPGLACNSLRSEVDGKEVFAIYYDAGHSVDEVCKLKARYGGNARSLNNDADFSDPC